MFFRVNCETCALAEQEMYLLSKNENENENVFPNTLIMKIVTS